MLTRAGWQPAMITVGLVLTAAAICFPAALAAKNQHHAVEERPIPHAVSLENGDLLFIRGNTWFSRLVTVASGEGAYTHVGMIEKGRDGAAWFIHAYPTEEVLADPPPAGIHRVPLEQYLSNEAVVDAVIYRLGPCVEVAASVPVAVTAARRFHDAGTPFNLQLDLHCTQRAYCSQLIWRCFLEAGIDLVEDRFDQLDSPFMRRRIIYPNSIAASPLLKREGSLHGSRKDPSS